MTEMNVNRDPILFEPIPKVIAEYYNTPYEVSRDQIVNYQKDGYIKMPKVLEGEPLAYVRTIIGEAVKARTEADKRVLKEKSQYEQSFLQCGYLCWDFPAVKEIVFGKRFAGIARDLMQVNGIRLWHDQALFKEPGGRITDMHQDTSYWPLNTENTTTIWLALTEVPVEKGCLGFIPGSHKSGVKEYVDIFDKPHTPDAFKESDLVNVPLNAGDATYHSGLVYHAANSNKTDEIREAMTIIYFEDGTPYTDEDQRNREHKSAVGTTSGAAIDTQYTPKLI
jgi:ectoine hydroxylase-related dioxygenase (phytanoyl-CoA dioxygenase family)